MEDTNQVLRAINGDDEAFLSVIHTHKLALYKTALAYLKNEEEAIEAIQEVTFRAYRNIHELRKPAYVKTWLIRIMINYCQNHLKKSRRTLYNDDLLLRQGKSDDYTYIELEEAMSKLDDDLCELLYLKYFHGLKIKDIAVMWKCPEGTIKTRLRNALRLLRSMLEEKGGKRSV
ncbi:sigma-70 family RNA polymerase sigma factor [Heyndrickxia sp. NPDC080065]|uniref:sigma-70 family RNA polymerase sigma factor n=1 Tax=Heyndrickxia sp. NPDC080065 TaxID=3390568 RepID=UPI003D043D9E